MSASNSPLTPDVCRAFVALDRAGGVLKDAAAELGETASALSRRLRPLQHAGPHLPCPWLRKEGKKLLPTDEGKEMLLLAAEVADHWDWLVATATRPRQPGLTVACGQEAAGGVVLAAAAAFHKAHPDTPLRIAVVRGHRRIEGVAGGHYDVALVTNTKADIAAIARRRDLTVRPLPDDELGLACATGARWAAEFAKVTEVTAARLADWPLVLPEKDAAVRQSWEAKVGKPPHAAPVPVIEVGGWRVLLGYVLAGFGVGLLPKSVTAPEVAAKRLIVRPLATALRPANQLRVVSRPDGENAALVKAFDAALR